MDEIRFLSTGTQSCDFESSRFIKAAIDFLRKTLRQCKILN